MADNLNNPTNTTGCYALSQPVKMPLRFWVMVDHGLLTREQAEAEWAKQQAAGVEFETLS